MDRLSSRLGLGAKWSSRYSLGEGGEIFGKVLGWLPPIFTRGVVLPLDEVLCLASFKSFCDNTVDFLSIGRLLKDLLCSRFFSNQNSFSRVYKQLEYKTNIDI